MKCGNKKTTKFSAKLTGRFAQREIINTVSPRPGSELNLLNKTMAQQKYTLDEYPGKFDRAVPLDLKGFR